MLEEAGQEETRMSDGGTTGYAYQPLELTDDTREFRLLRLLPSKDFDDDIRCELFHSPFDSYEALSYTWGDPHVTVPIVLHGIPHHVTTNLGLALRYIRYKDRPRIMWIDALCINQKDVLEKNHQVAQMREIFLDAEQVVVWLGEEGTAKRAIDLCKLLEGRGSHGNGLSKKEFAQYSQEFQACDELFHERAWWKRTWILQEILHTNPVEVCIGNIRIGLDELVEMWARHIAHYLMDGGGRYKYSHGAFLALVRTMVQPIGLIGRERERIRQRDTEPHFLSFLTGQFRAQEASDPRDKIFALVGISSERQCFVADYNLECRDVYVRTTRKLLANTMDPLLQVESLDRSIAFGELPSWTPDYASRQSTIAQFMSICSSKFVAAPPKNEWVLLDWSTKNGQDDGVHGLNGLYVAIVTGVTTKKVTQSDSVTLIRYDEDQGQRNGTFDWDDWPPSASDTTMYNTSWGPRATEVGDIIIVAEGCPVPLVFRNDGEFYLLVGPCWLIVGEVKPWSLWRILLYDDLDFSDDYEVKNTSKLGTEDPGFSDIMRGRVWGNPMYFGKEESIWESAKEEFRLH